MPDQVLGQVGGAVAGGLLGGQEGGGSSTVVQKADPWEGVQPALRTLYDAGLQNFLGQGKRYYPSSTVAPQSGVTGLAQQGVYNLATQPSPVLQGAQQQAYSTLGGDYLYGNPAMQDLYNLGGRDFLGSSPVAADLYGSTQQDFFGRTPGMEQLYDTAAGSYLNANPYLDEMFNAASNRLGEQYSKFTLPSIASMFSAGGRYGSNQMAEGLGQAQQRFGDVLRDLGTDIYGANYARERGQQQAAQTAMGQFGLSSDAQRQQALSQLMQGGLQGQQLQQQALGQVGDIYGKERYLQGQMTGLAPGLDQADYFGMNQLGQLGAQQDAYNQSLLNADIGRFNFGQQQPYDQLSFLSSLLQGYPQGQTTSQSVSQPGDWLTGAMGGARAGGAMADWWNARNYNPNAYMSNWGNTASDEALSLFF